MTTISGTVWISPDGWRGSKLHDDLEIAAPKVLSAPWKTTRIFRRYPDRHHEIIEGECDRICAACHRHYGVE
jgi:hypothetical protein